MADIIIGFLAAILVFVPIIGFIRDKSSNSSCKTCKGDCRFCYTKDDNDPKP